MLRPRASNHGATPLKCEAINASWARADPARSWRSPPGRIAGDPPLPFRSSGGNLQTISDPVRRHENAKRWTLDATTDTDHDWLQGLAGKT